MSRSLDRKPYMGEMIKPSELIELRGTGPLTLEDRRIYNLLIEHAWGPKLVEVGHFFEIPTTALKLPTESNHRLVKSIERLMRTLVVAKQPDGSETRLQLLSTNNLTTTANTGTFRYSFPVQMAELLKDSQIFAKLDLDVMRSFSSKYAFALYESLSRRVRLKHVFTEEFTVEEMRDLLGVPQGKLGAFKNLNKYAIEPAVTEVNAITPYTVNIVPRKEGRKVVSLLMGWEMKSESDMKEAYREMNRPRVGRRARINGSAEGPTY